MADQQPGEDTPAAGQPDPTGAEAPAEEPTTADAPARWSGSAAVPPPAPRRSRFGRRRGALPVDEPDDRVATPAVDPWAGQDTPWDPMPLPPPPNPPSAQTSCPPQALPPTRIDRAPGAEPPPVRTSPPAPRAPAGISPPTRIEHSATGSPPAVPHPPPAPRKHPWGRRRTLAPGPVDRFPGAARPLPPPPPRRPTAHRPPAQTRPARPLPPAPRRRRRWPRNLAVFTLLSVACCCGVPAYFTWPAAGQYPVSATLPASVADLELRDDAAGRRAAERLKQDLGADAFAGVYGDADGKRVTVFGVTGFRLTPQQDVEAQVTRLTAEYDIRDVATYDLGESGAHERCGVGRTGRSTVAVCVWADHGSLATVLLTRRSVSDSAELTGRLRSAVLTPG